jgi:ABC-type Zn uptake system ZnuABC Zn-binding protein ZnuA
MRALVTSLAMVVTLAASGCAGRQVEVTTGPQPAADVSLRLTNNLSQAVNVYVTTGGTDVFLKQVSANSVEVLPVAGIPAGTTVTLKARTVDGTRTYTRDNVQLATNYDWRVP